MLSAKDTFAERLKELLQDRGVYQARLAEVLNTTPQAVSSYVNGKTTPDYDTLCNIAEFFGVTTDFLLGVSHTLSDEEDELLAEMKETGNVDFYFLRSFRQFKSVRDNLFSLYRGNIIAATEESALTYQFTRELRSVCRKYGAISEKFGYWGADRPEWLGFFDAFGNDFPYKLGELVKEPDFNIDHNEHEIIAELIRMEQALK